MLLHLLFCDDQPRYTPAIVVGMNVSSSKKSHKQNLDKIGLMLRFEILPSYLVHPGLSWLEIGLRTRDGPRESTVSLLETNIFL